MYSEAVRRGGTLVSVKADESRADAVQDILDDHDPIDPLGRAAEYRKGGWASLIRKRSPIAHRRPKLNACVPTTFENVEPYS